VVYNVYKACVLDPFLKLPTWMGIRTHSQCASSHLLTPLVRGTARLEFPSDGVELYGQEISRHATKQTNSVNATYYHIEILKLDPAAGLGKPETINKGTQKESDDNELV
jgi:hypothetical protein